MKKILAIFISALLLLASACAKTPEAPAGGSDSALGELPETSEELVLPQTPKDTESKPEEPSEDAAKLIFDTADFDGNSFTMESIGDASLIMVNMWEPWCGPCVKELPELQELYEKYKDEGLLIVGAFSTGDMDDEVAKIIQNSGITYPVVRADSNILQFATDYVPTTIFADAQGNILSAQPIVGANDLAGWEEIVGAYLN